MAETKSGEKKIIPVGEGFFHIPSSPGEKAHLIGSKCSNCGYISFPKVVVCPSCVRDDTMKETPLSGKATLKRFTLAERGPTGFQVPYIMAYVQLAEGPIIYTLVTGVEQKMDALTAGQKMEMVIDKIRTDAQGNDIIGWKFKPAK